jgi:hypothetical protein
MIYDARAHLSSVMPALVADIHVLLVTFEKEVVDGRDSPAMTTESLAQGAK